MSNPAKTLALAGCVAICVAASGCPSPSRPSQSQGAVIRTSIGADPASLSLIGKTDAVSEMLAALITDSLVKYDANLELEPRLAESWTVSPDGLEWTFRLRDGVRWQDGAPFTADDVVYTVNKVRDPASQSRSYLAAFEDLTSVAAIDARTVRVVYRTAYADAIDSWTLPIVPAHVVSKDADLLTGDFARHPVGCGPYRLVRAEAGHEIVLEANPDYWDGAPANSGITIQVIPNERTAYEAIVRGDLDMMPVTYDLWAEAQKSDTARRLSRLIYLRLGVWMVGWNQDGSNPFFGDARVRKAMVLALDRATFASEALHDLAKPAVTTYPPGSPWADPSLAPWPFDPAESARLLREAGFRDSDGDGVLDRDGRAFRFSLLIPASSQEIVDRMAAWFQDSLSKVGVGVTIEKAAWAAFQERRAGHRFEAVMASLSFSPAADQYELFHSASYANGMNYQGVHDDEIDRLLVEGRRTFDRSARRDIYHALQRRIHETEPISCLFHFAVPVLYDARLTGLSPSPIGLWLAAPGPRNWRWGPKDSSR